MTSSTEYYQIIMDERRKHPQKIYYMKAPDTTAIVASHVNKRSSEYRKYYSIDTKHLILASFVKALEQYADKYESYFQSYCKQALSDDGNMENIPDAILSELHNLHPFFQMDEQNKFLYIQRQLIRYYKDNFHYYVSKLVHKYKGQFAGDALQTKVAEETENIFGLLLNPILKRESPLPQKKCRALWENFLYSEKNSLKADLKEDNISSVIPYLVKCCISDMDSVKPAEGPILRDLLFLQKVLSKYTFIFSDILVNVPNLTATQSYCLFLSRYEYAEISRILEDRKILSTPDDMYSLLTAESSRDGDMIIMDGSEDRFDRWTDYAYKDLCDLIHIADAKQRKIQAGKIKASLDVHIPPDADNIFRYEIYEFYYFEQLIFMEILEMVKHRYFIRKCKNSCCSNYYITNRRNHAYCISCAGSRKAPDKKYRESLNPLEKVINQQYHHLYYSASTLPEDEKNLCMAKLKKERAAARQLLKQYEAEGRFEDTEGFKNDLKEHGIF